MAITIEDPEVERLARRLAAEQGVSVGEAVAGALRARLGERRPELPPPVGTADRDDRAAAAERLRRMTEYLDATRAELLALPTLDDRPADEMLYDEYGLPK